MRVVRLLGTDAYQFPWPAPEVGSSPSLDNFKAVDYSTDGSHNMLIGGRIVSFGLVADYPSFQVDSVILRDVAGVPQNRTFAFTHTGTDTITGLGRPSEVGTEVRLPHADPTTIPDWSWGLGWSRVWPFSGVADSVPTVRVWMEFILRTTDSVRYGGIGFLSYGLAMGWEVFDGDAYEGSFCTIGSGFLNATGVPSGANTWTGSLATSAILRWNPMASADGTHRAMGAQTSSDSTTYSTLGATEPVSSVITTATTTEVDGSSQHYDWVFNADSYDPFNDATPTPVYSTTTGKLLLGSVPMVMP